MLSDAKVTKLCANSFSKKNGAPFLLPVKSVHEFLATSTLRSRKKRCYSTGFTEITRLRTTWTVASGRARSRSGSILLQQAPTPKNTTSRPSAVPSAVRVHYICSCQCYLRSPATYVHPKKSTRADEVYKTSRVAFVVPFTARLQPCSSEHNYLPAGNVRGADHGKPNDSFSQRERVEMTSLGRKKSTKS